jgi:hypothetical protein
MKDQRSEVGKRRTKGPRTEDRRQMTENRRSENQKIRRLVCFQFLSLCSLLYALCSLPYALCLEPLNL